jgi:hypothetical protein
MRHVLHLMQPARPGGQSGDEGGPTRPCAFPAIDGSADLRLPPYPNVTMVGSLTRTGDRLVYSETISDTVLGSVQITSTCKPILEWSLM